MYILACSSNASFYSFHVNSTWSNSWFISVYILTCLLVHAYLCKGTNTHLVGYHQSDVTLANDISLKDGSVTDMTIAK